jgi:hypothetical protein
MINFEKKFKMTWTPDCQGKEDFDGAMVFLSTRIYPRGGSSDIWEIRDGVVVDHSKTDDPRRQGIKPSGYAHIVVFGVNYERSFEAETTEQLKKDIEAWYSQYIERAQNLLRTLPLDG